jgi:hypothetical protein
VIVGNKKVLTTNGLVLISHNTSEFLGKKSLAKSKTRGLLEDFLIFFVWNVADAL